MNSRAVPGSILLDFYPRYVRLPGQYQILKGNPVPSDSDRTEFLLGFAIRQTNSGARPPRIRRPFSFRRQGYFGIVQMINDTVNVDGLCRAFKQRVEKMVERDGDRICH